MKDSLKSHVSDQRLIFNKKENKNSLDTKKKVFTHIEKSDLRKIY